MSNTRQSEAIQAFHRVHDAYNNLTISRIDPALEYKAAMVIDAAWRGCLYPEEVQTVLELDKIIQERTK